MCAGYNNTLYSLSMTMNFRRRYITDFGRIEGIPGVYMANQLSSKMLTDPSAMRSLDFEKFIQTKVRFALWPHAMSCIPALPLWQDGCRYPKAVSHVLWSMLQLSKGMLVA